MKTKTTQLKNNNKGQVGAIILVVAIFMVALFISALGFDTVEANHRGVMVKMGQIQGIMMPGMQWTGLFTDVISYDLRMRQMTVNMDGSGAAVDKDGQSVYASIDINYRINPDSIENAYTKIGIDSEIAKTLNIEGIIKESFKAVTSKYTSTEIWQNREQIKKEAISKINENFPNQYFTIENVVVTNLDYNPAFKAAIESQKVNEKLALSKEAEVKIAQYEADKTIQNARGAAESAKLAADADAYTRLVMAQSEAEALRMKKNELTPLMVQNNMIDRWDGKYPEYLIITGTGGSNFLMQLPSNGASATN